MHGAFFRPPINGWNSDEQSHVKKGAFIHYVDELNAHRPALIVETQIGNETTVELRVDAPGSSRRTVVADYSQDHGIIGSWHWPADDDNELPIEHKHGRRKLT